MTPMFSRLTLARLMAVAVTLMLAVAAGAATLQGRVEKVIDGDSLIFKPDGDAPALEVRLHGIDAPEGCQSGGPAAREYLQEFVRDKPARLVTRGKDSYGRTLGLLTVDDLLVNERMVAEGHAWSLRGKSGQGPYVAKEKVAIALKRGLHATHGAVAPWEFRRSNGRCGDPAPAASAAVAARAAASPPLHQVAEAAGFRCDGRTHCSQMRSCDEAKYFLAHCPGVAMDGNGDGIPCERQWCR